MIICFKITYGRYLKDSMAMFKEADENNKVATLRQQTRVHDLIELEDETNEITSERKDEINIVDVNNKLQLNDIEKEKVVVISDDDRDIYKEKYNINYTESNIFKVLHNLYEYFTKQLTDYKITALFSDENIRTFVNVYSDFKQRTSKIYGSLDRKSLTVMDLYPIFLFGLVFGGNHCLSYIYFHNPNQSWFHKITYKVNKYEIMYTKQIPIVTRLDFTQGKQYNIREVDSWFNTITNRSESDTNLKNNILSMLGSFEYSYGKYLLDVADIFKRKDESDEEEKEKDKIKRIEMAMAKMKPHVINDDVSKKLAVIRDDVAEDINNLFKSKKKT
jgi:hypothetical protein